jgi:hypothetical protein
MPFRPMGGWPHSLGSKFTTCGGESAVTEARASRPHTFHYHDVVSVIAFTALAYSPHYSARKPLRK